ncbi:MAG: TIGR03790 family protein [Chthoniobacterales bacterium]|nr:TIGR03790 family protein [Chthoniobacterales bacterium]
MKSCFLVLVVLYSLGTSLLARDAAELARATLVVYNRAAPDSTGLARYYAQLRQIPNDHLIGLDCSLEEEISRQEYDQTIAEPLRKAFIEHQWWKSQEDASGQMRVSSSQIHFVALIRGMPLKVRATADYPGDHPESNILGSQNEASVDSELATLGLFSRQISGVAPNPYFQNFRPIGELDGVPILLVTRLDAPTAGIVRRMIADAVEAEKAGLWGRAYVDGAHNTSGGLADGDEWLRTVVKDLRRVGIPVVYDRKPSVFPSGYPVTNCVLYYGWYAGGISGPFAEPDFVFPRGAIAVHIHSFSANTLRHADANWVAPLLSKGATASLGNVYEPYLQMTAHLDIFNDRLLHGFTLAESAYMATRALSWMTVVVGDPLYRPYAAWLQLDSTKGSSAHNDWIMSHEFALKKIGLSPADYFPIARQAASRADNGPMLEDLGLRQEEVGDNDSALGCLRQARTIYRGHGDLLRAGLEQADTLIEAGRKDEALPLLKSLMRTTAEGTGATLLHQVLDQIVPPSPTSPPPAPRP